MTITYGFYDSISSDRLYNAKQMGSIFDGLILDGVYAGLGDKLMVVEDTGMNVSVGTGRAWFDHTWTYNNAAIGKTIPTADPLLNRIDVVYLEVNENVGVRANSIDVLEGTPASSPVAPDLTNTSTIHQYALAHIYVGAAVTEIVQANITNMVGTVDTPFVALLEEYEELQAQIWAIVGDTNPPLINIITLKTHNHDGSPTVQIPAGSIAAGAVDTPELAAGAVITSKLAADAVDDNIVGNRVPALSMRQGGSPTIWKTPGSTDFFAAMVRMQSGAKNIPFTSGQGGASVAVTFPVAFAYAPIVLAQIAQDYVAVYYSNHPALIVDNISTSGFNLKIDLYDETFGGSDSLAITWLAIGPE